MSQTLKSSPSRFHLTVQGSKLVAAGRTRVRGRRPIVTAKAKADYAKRLTGVEKSCRPLRCTSNFRNRICAFVRLQWRKADTTLMSAMGRKQTLGR